MGKYYHSSIPDTELDGVCYDTRSMKPNTVFVCINGSFEDGHKYAVRAVSKGARVIIASKHIDCGAAVILTDDTESALHYLIKRFYGKPRLELFGITGTNGKTTTSYMLAAILKASGRCCGIIGTNGCFVDGEDVGIVQNTPTTPNMPELYAILAKMEEMGADCAVMEVSSHSLVQNRVDGLDIKTGVFTNLSGDHLDYHRDMEDYFAAKRRLFDISENAAVNADDEYGRRILAENENAVGFGILGGEVRAGDISLFSDGAEFELIFGKTAVRQRINISGLFSVYNALAAATAAYVSGVDIADIKAGLASVGGVVGRMERLAAGDVNVIIDYAHTPDGLLKVLSSLRGIGGRIITVFGCGGDRDRTKRAVMGDIATQNSDITVITSDNPRTENPTEIIIDILSGVKRDNYIVIENRERAIEAALSIAKKGDTVLLAGKGQERYQIIGREKRHFDEREIVERLLKERNGESYAGVYN
ncbi:MAG: UDP-N-acetylmuramoyl-L-alanyl-D-glutamate--2,6-diaminopimelate ligase [Clostridia bacterium]|nr:UDP-N-acetylmuramoyl-L-alanyl-D-glutamate--2,6-diaminopimelate ligase [Clostridia bacterium]